MTAGYEHQRWEVSAVTANIAGQQRQPADRRMRSNEEVRQNTSPLAIRAAILCKYLTGEEQSGLWYRCHFNPDLFEENLQVFHTVIANRQFCINNGIYQKRAWDTRRFKLRDRPIRPIRVTSGNIE
jgi:hypothetical protein